MKRTLRRSAIWLAASALLFTALHTVQAAPARRASARREAGGQPQVEAAQEQPQVEETEEQPLTPLPRPGLQLYEPDCPPLDRAPEYIVPLTSIRADLRLPANTQLPIDCSAPLFSQPPGRTRDALGRYIWPRSDFWFAATDFSHQPLYWDNQVLERYGQSQKPILEPFFSGAHFFATFAIIPYKIGIDRTHDRIYTLGYYRPGSPTPCLCQRLPWEWDAAAFETLAVLGFIFILP
jgi:hypothetical protein